MKSAVIMTGGKQYFVTPGTVLNIEKIKDESLQEGGKVVFPDVLMVSDGDSVQLGTPRVEGARVEATLVKSGRARKITVIHFKSKARQRKKAGHRQPYFSVRIDSIA